MLANFAIQSAVKAQRQKDLYRQLIPISQGVTPAIEIDGKEYINFASNDYLGLATDPQLTQAFTHATQTINQVGSGASHLITGHSIWHEQLDKTLAKVTGYERALTFSTGYMANMGVIQALCHKDSVIFSDKLNHASIVDGAILSRAKVIRFAHRDYTQLAALLEQSSAKQKLIVTDHVFSMDGTVADLDVLQALAEHYECALMVDDAHGFGLPYQAYKTQIPAADIYIGTFGKAIGTSGAFVAGSSELIEYLINFARSFIYTTAMPPVLACVTDASIKLSQSERARSDNLMANIRHLRDGLCQQGWQVGIDEDMPMTAIIPVVIGDNDKTLHLANALNLHGFWVSAIRPPTVPIGTARLRFCVSASHSDQQISDLLAVMQTLK